MAAEGNVRVALRVRPLIGREVVEHESECIVQPDQSIAQVTIGSEKTFAFDHVYGVHSTQSQVYAGCVQTLLESFLSGFNSTILAYGQTGSGKTWTIGTANQAHCSHEELGVIPRTARALFEEISKRKKESPASEFTVKVCFLEIYGEDIRDLLNVGSSKVLSIRELDAGISVAGATERTCDSMLDMLGALEEGSMCRTTGSTMMNAHSSRSHAIFTIILDQRIPYNAEEGPALGASADIAGDKHSDGAVDVPKADAMEHRVSKFHILDLAGSERAKRTQATGKRLQEGININLGLLALGNVISALGDEEKRRKGAHVPYRDSKLTRILQDSLGGNSKTLMIACVSPAEVNFEESLNTLRYAARARNIKNKPVINRDANANQIAQLKAEIEALRSQLHITAGLRPGGVISGSPSLRGAGVSLQALLDATGATTLSEVVDKLAAMRSASEEVEALRTKFAVSDDELLRLTQELKKVRLQLDTEVEVRMKSEMRRVALEDFLLAAGTDVGSVPGYAGTGQPPGIPGLLKRIRDLEVELSIAKESARHAFMSPQTGSVQPSPAEAANADAELRALLAEVDQQLLVGLDDDDDVATSTAGGTAPSSPLSRKLSFEDVTANGLSPAPRDESSCSPDELAFTRRQARMENHVDVLDSNIGAKEKLVQVLIEKNRELERVKSIYDARFREMQSHIIATTKEKERLQLELTKVEHVAEEERERVKAELMSKLAATTERLRDLQSKAKDAEALSKIRSRTDSEIKKLQADIQALRKAKTAQLTMMKVEKQKFQEVLAARNKDVQRLQKEGEDLKSQLAKVKADGQKREVVLRRKMEEAAVARRKLRGQAEAGPSSPASPPTTMQGRERARNAAVAAVARSVKAVRRRTVIEPTVEVELANPAAIGTPHSSLLRRQLEDAVQRIAEKDKRVEELERRLRAREQDVKMLESLIEQRDAIKSSINGAVAATGEAGEERLYLSEKDKAAGFDATLIDDINAFFETADRATAGVPAPQKVSPSSLVGRIELTSEEEAAALAELEDQIEAAQARLQFQDERILNLAQADDDISRDLIREIAADEQVKGTTPIVDMEALSSKLPLDVESLPQAKVAVGVMFNMLVGLKREERNKNTVLGDMKVRVQELQQSLQSSDDAIKALRLEHERRMMDLQREQSAEMDMLLRLAASTAGFTIQAEKLSGDAADGANVLELATPSELISMLKATRERFDGMQADIMAQQEVISKLQGERESLRGEINRLSTIALRQQETQQRKLSSEAKKAPITKVHKRHSHKNMHAGDSGPIAVHGMKIGAMWMPTGPMESGEAPSNPRSTAHPSGDNMGRRSMASMASAVSDSDGEDGAASVVSVRSGHLVGEVGEQEAHRDQARAWWSERGITPIHASARVAPPPPLQVAASLPVEKRGEERRGEDRRGEERRGEDRRGGLPPPAIPSKGGALKSKASEVMGKTSDSGVGIVMDARRTKAAIKESKSGVVVVTELSLGSLHDAPKLASDPAPAAHRRSLSSKFRHAHVPNPPESPSSEPTPNALAVVGIKSPVMSEPMHVRTTMSDIMSPNIGKPTGANPAHD